MPDLDPPRPSEDSETASVQAPRRPGAAMYRSKSLLRLGLEVLLISAGVFLGLMGEQWRERAQHRELAEQALRRFRTEIRANHAAVTRVKDYHVITKKGIDAYLAADAKARPAMSVRMEGFKPVAFEHTAWDLALATQSLAYFDPQLGFALSRIYGNQEMYSDLTGALTQAMYLRPPSRDFEPFFEALSVYYADIVVMEPALLRLYDEILPQIDRALGESPEATTAVRR